MAMLHTVNKSPFENRTLESCLNHAADGSAVLLIEDAIFGARKGNIIAEKITSSASRLSMYVLGPDVRARGIAEDQIMDGISVVDYDGFVDLVTKHDKVQSWL